MSSEERGLRLFWYTPLGEAWQGKVGVAGRRISGEAERHRGPTGSVCPFRGQTLRHPAGAVKPTVWVHLHVALGRWSVCFSPAMATQTHQA